MGEANFYYFTCLKLHLVFSGLQLFEREMANSLAIVLVLATIAHLGCSRMMTGDWASKVCAAYYKASKLGAFPPVYPGGFGWNDKVCLADPSFYLECKFVNGVFVGEKRQCPPGFCWCAFADGTKIPNTKVPTAFSTLTDAKCMILRMKVPTPTEEIIIPIGMTKRQ